MKQLFFLFFSLLYISLTAQNIGINGTGAVANSSAILDVDAAPSYSLGFLMPRLTTGQRIAIPSPADGLMVYDKNLGGIYRYSTINNKWDCAQTPAGTVQHFANITAPIGYVICDGASYSTTIYPELFTAIGYLYGGAGASFNVPDLRGEFIRGIDNGRGLDLGRVFGSTQGDDFKSHFHSVDPPNTLTDVQGNHAHNYTDMVPETPTDGSYGVGNPNQTHREPYPRVTDVQGAHQHNLDISPFNSASTGNAETRPINVALLPCIKY